MENKLTRNAARYLASRMNVHTRKEGIEFEKMAVGMEIVLINVSKAIIVYSLAAWFGILVQTFFAHAAFSLLKRYSFGLHALNSTVCTAVSCSLFILIPLVLIGVSYRINPYMLVAVYIVIIAILYRYAPADTKSRPLIGARLRRRLKTRAVICGVALAVVSILVPDESIRLSLTLGAVYQSAAILPVTYRLLRRSERNYEAYEYA
ncbi:MAG: accessory gene regulator B family protein [Defluviitaleaceae bacterium]|nr:accessory gene regulator B family protein [Defluviitaleaceae bacterium]